jgi:predicted phage terminase large subunit-like protein
MSQHEKLPPGVTWAQVNKIKRDHFWSTWLAHRQRARTDLYWLCTDVLRYRDLEEEVHRPITDFLLPRFEGCEDKLDMSRAEPTLIASEPRVPLVELARANAGALNSLLLYPRGTLKTSIATIGKSIQWILNYPDIRLLFSSAINMQGEAVLRETKSHFQFNEYMRFYFPELCPPAAKAADWGSNEQFTVMGRKRFAKEATVSVCSVGKVIAGMHYEVIFNTDLVDKENVKTPNQISEVINHFRYMRPLLEPHCGWMYVEGTPYDFSDLYNTIQDEEARRPADEHQWRVLVGDCFKPDNSALWATRLPLSKLRQLEIELGPYIFNCQYRCKPVPMGTGLASPAQIRFKPWPVLKTLLPMLRLHVTIDVAGMDPQSEGDYTVITLAGFDRDGRIYILEINRGHFSPFEVIEIIFKLHAAYPRIFDFKIEKDAHARVLLPFLQRECAKRQKFPNMVPMRRDNRVSKQHRIRGLQPWFAADPPIIHFSDSINCRADLISEITRFPAYSHDDILDTLADQMQNREGDGVTADVYPDAPRETIPTAGPAALRSRFIGFEPGTGRELWSDKPWVSDLGGRDMRTGL